ncbi:C6 zinc finger domain-containing protein [Phlyctema vagabunda]|uniref:C6 zinc finger domain-containing protein n=1 Tax=Phlyctema vagabunda TaxID=108571 RepID=A0ABR4P1N7_9HELO
MQVAVIILAVLAICIALVGVAAFGQMWHQQGRLPGRSSSACDEGKPQCANCLRQKASCSYLQHIPLASRPRHHNQHVSVPQYHRPPLILPSQPLVVKPVPRGLNSLPIQFTSLDLELLHFYTTNTSIDVLGPDVTGTRVWQTEAVVLALNHPFLLHELFSFAALHLANVKAEDPAASQKYRNVAATYYARSISQFRMEIQNINQENCHATFSCSALLGFHAWAVQAERGANLFFSGEEDEGGRGSGTDIAWYKLHRGANHVLNSVFHWICDGPLWDMIRPWMSLSPNDPMILKPEDERELDAVAACWAGDDVSDTERETLEETLQTLRRTFSTVTTKKAEIGDSAAILSWIILIPDSFCFMVEERYPQALVLIAVYCVLLKKIDHLWWIKGKAANLLAAVEKRLPPGWEPWLAWAMQVVNSPVSDDSTIAGLEDSLITTL